MTRAPRRYLDAALCVLLPPSCGSCLEALNVRPTHGLCGPCFEALESARELFPKRLLNHLDGFAAPHLYGGPMADLISRLKFGGERSVSRALAALSDAPTTRPRFRSAATHIVPLPLGPKRLRTRGFNQSALISRHLAKRWGLKVSHCLIRRHDTQPQTKLNAADRLINVEGAFSVQSLAVPKRIILLDDVVTTGATMQEAARALRRAGVEQIFGLAMALTP